MRPRVLPINAFVQSMPERLNGGLVFGRDRPTVEGVPPRSRHRPTAFQWLRYAFGGGLPPELAEWVLADTTARTWWLRHLGRAVVQLIPVIVLLLVAVPVPFGYRLAAAAGGTFLALVFSAAYMTETTEHRVVKAGFESGTAAQIREERAELARVERRSRYRQDGSGSFD